MTAVAYTRIALRFIISRAPIRGRFASCAFDLRGTGLSGPALDGSAAIDRRSPGY